MILLHFNYDGMLFTYFVLVGGNLPVPGLKWDTQPPALILNLLHTS